MSEDDSEGCGFAIAATIIVIVICHLVWSYNHPTPAEKLARQQTEQRERDDRDLAEWNRAKQLREMRAEKTQPENKEGK